ncbi:MAG: hypothetical protein HFF86_08090 [Oscillibacter sp.]|nr:hypothetical protein [Oscillibacter sp.]
MKKKWVSLLLALTLRLGLAAPAPRPRCAGRIFVWALMHADSPSWSLCWNSKCNSATKFYDFTVIYDTV